jgi:hypothetical protein
MNLRRPRSNGPRGKHESQAARTPPVTSSSNGIDPRDMETERKQTHRQLQLLIPMPQGLAATQSPAPLSALVEPPNATGVADSAVEPASESGNPNQSQQLPPVLNTNSNDDYSPPVNQYTSPSLTVPSVVTGTGTPSQPEQPISDSNAATLGTEPAAPSDSAASNNSDTLVGAGSPTPPPPLIPTGTAYGSANAPAVPSYGAPTAGMAQQPLNPVPTNGQLQPSNAASTGMTPGSPGAMPGAPSLPGSLPGTPLPGSPAGTPLPGSPAGTKLPGSPAGTPLPRSPVGTPTPGSPAGTPVPGSPSGTPLPGSPAGTPLPGSPAGTPLPGSPVGTPTPGSPAGTPLPGSPAGTPVPGSTLPGSTLPGSPAGTTPGSTPGVTGTTSGTPLSGTVPGGTPYYYHSSQQGQTPQTQPGDANSVPPPKVLPEGFPLDPSARPGPATNSKDSNRPPAFPATQSAKNPKKFQCKSTTTAEKLYCRVSSNVSAKPGEFAILFLMLAVLCVCRKRLFGNDQDARGEYRSVAHHYADVAFDDTFDDEVSSGDNDEYMSDDEEEGWSNGGKHVIEMKTLESEKNGGLTLEEMNG